MPMAYGGSTGPFHSAIDLDIEKILQAGKHPFRVSTTIYNVRVPHGDVAHKLGLKVKSYQQTHGGNSFNVLMGTGDVIAHINAYRRQGEVTINVLGSSLEAAQKVCEKAVGLFPKIPLSKEPDVVYVRFMTVTNGIETFYREIQAPAWSEIEHNYPKTSKDQLEALFNLRPPFEEGKIILWHGVPGSGKSYAIRSLAREWRDWANLAVVIDPETIFSQGALLTQMVLEQDNNDKWTVFVMEDTDQFMRANTAANSKGGLSKLLNMADGILGQGLKVLWLITTNEPIEQLHPAIVRSGRALSNIELGNFTETEAREWLKKHKSEADPKGLTLADLYATVR